MNIAMVFPGQGSQSHHMLSQFYEMAFFQNAFNEAADILGYDLKALITSEDERIHQTQYTQPALLVVSYALYQLWRDHYPDIKPQVFAGHSLGEYTALVAANVLSFSDAVRLVALRGQLMASALPEGEGAMAAVIGLDKNAIVALCDQAEFKNCVWPANYNSPVQTVLAGKSETIDKAIIAAKSAGAKIAKRIPVSAPSHCPLMQDASIQLQSAIEATDFNEPTAPMIFNVSAEGLTKVSDIKKSLIDQLVLPVQWVDSVNKMVSQYQADTILECGPGKVLTGLNKRIDKSLQLMTLDCQSLAEVHDAMASTSV